MQLPESPDSRVKEWQVTLKQRYPNMSVPQVNELAVKLACMSRAERRKFFKVSSPKLPTTKVVPRQ